MIQDIDLGHSISAHFSFVYFSIRTNNLSIILLAISPCKEDGKQVNNCHVKSIILSSILHVCQMDICQINMCQIGKCRQ